MGVGTQVPGPGEADVCQFFATDGTASFAIFIYRGSNPDAAERSYQALTNPHWDPVPGLGDEAKANSSPGSGDIAVRQGSFVVDIQISSSKLTPTLQNLETMAVEAIGRA
jgi:hypothetical protein